MASRTMKASLIKVMVVVFVGVTCQCKPLYRDKQVFNVVETEVISSGKMLKKIATESAPRQVAEYLAQTANKSSIIIIGGYIEMTIRELLDLDTYDSTNMTDCTIGELGKRQATCKRMPINNIFKKYCDACVEQLIEFCDNFPYVRVLEESLNEFDWRSYDDVYQFSKIVMAHVIKYGDEELSAKENLVSFLETKDANYKQETKKQCKSFKTDADEHLYQFGTTNNKSVELLRGIDIDLRRMYLFCDIIETL